MKFPILCGAALTILVGALPLSAASLNFDFTGGNRAATLSGVTSGITVSPFRVNNLTHIGANGVIQIRAGDVGSASVTGISGGQYLAFDVTVPAGIAVSFTSMAVNFDSSYTGTDYSNARVFSSVGGYANPGPDTIGIVGKETGDGTGAATDTLNLVTFTGNSGRGANILAGSLGNLTNRTITFYLPWIDGISGITPYTDILSLKVDFDIGPVAAAPGSLKVTDFQVTEGGAISFETMAGRDYLLLAAGDLAGPVYRKHWLQIGAVTGSPGGIRTLPLGSPSASKQFYVVTESTGHPVARIMPVGDSITEGNAQASSGKFYSYRGPLYDKLRTAGYHFEYVGTRTPERDYNSPVYGAVTLNHLGQGGANAQVVKNNLAAAFPGNPADIVLIHSGHNYDLKNNTESQIIGFVESATRSMVTLCRTVNPGVKILLAQVITSPKLSDNSTIVKYGYIPALNTRLAQVAAELNTEQSPIIIVNQAEGWDTPTDAIGDQVHPTQAGAEKMAQKWFSALVPLME